MSILGVERAAEELLASLAMVRPPISVLAVAKALKLNVLREPLQPGVSGLLVTPPGGSSHVVVNVADPPNRRRFTIAHEIGHFFLRHQFQTGSHVHVDRGNYISQRGPASAEGVDAKEVEANQFAAALLMPRQMVLAKVAEHGGRALHDHDVDALANTFQVSGHAMSIRLQVLGAL